MTEEEVTLFIFNSLNQYLNMDQINRVMDMVILLIQQIYDSKSGKYTVDGSLLDTYTTQLIEEFGCTHDIYMHIFRVLCVVRYNSMRKLIMEQLGKLKKYKINLYGALDIKIEGVTFGGYINTAAELSKALQCSSITMQINPDATMNQRVIEGILSGTLSMIFKVNPEYDMSCVDKYLNPNEGICYFQSKQDLISHIDYFLAHEEDRRKVINRGIETALSNLTNTKVFDHLISELSTKILETDSIYV